MAVLQGTNVGIAWGSSVSGITYTGSGTITNTSDSTTFEADTVELKNSLGDIIAIYHYNYRAKLSLTCFPSGATPQTAIPEIGSSITIASADSDINGTWVVTASSKAYKSDGILEFSIECTSWSNLTPN